MSCFLGFEDVERDGMASESSEDQLWNLSSSNTLC